MRWRRQLMVGGAVLAGLVVAVLVTWGGGGAASPFSKATKHDPGPIGLTISLPARATGRRVPDGFLGLSLEFQAVRAYTGSDPRRINPVLEQLIRNLSPGQAPMLRIGGNSTDVSYAPGPGVTPPRYIAYPLTPSWMATTGALIRQLGARMIMGVNLAADNPALAATESRDFVRAFGRGAIEALEIGNEPNIYSRITIYHTPGRVRLHARPRTFEYPAYRREFRAIAQAAPHLELAGPALTAGPTASRGSWLSEMSNFLRSDPRVRIMTVHRYPLRSCYVPPASLQYPTVPHLLSPYSTTGLAAGVRGWIAVAHRQHRQLRIDELNSVSCRGRAGISDVFASSLWATDALFSLVNAGADGVNLHTLPDSAYELFAFHDVGGRWSADVRPVYYGLQLFAEAAPPGSRLLWAPGLAAGSSALSVWATRGPDRVDRVVVIDKDPSRAASITLRPPAGTARRATLERMQAPSVDARSGVSLGGHTYGSNSTTGRLAPAITEALRPGAGGDYTVTVPAASAALVTLPAGRRR